MNDKKELIMRIARGEKVDRIPVSIWRHFYDLETSPEGLAKAMIDFQKKYDWDFMKVNPRACYHAETFGAKYRMSIDPKKNHVRIGSPVASPNDWLKLKPASLKEGALAEQAQALRLIKKEFGESLFILQTVFHPFSIASDLLETPKDLIPHYQDHWSKLKNGLEVITETFRNYTRTLIREGTIDGLFFAIKDWGTSDLINDEDYCQTAKSFDLALLEEADPGKLNILHVCKSNNRLFSFLDYPVHGFNWDATDSTNPGLKEVAAKTDKLIIGGVAHRGNLLSGSKKEVEREVEGALIESAGSRFILAAGCTVSSETPDENLFQLRNAVTPQT